jgi:hypothetical protein
MYSKTPLFHGMLGGGVVIAIFIILLFSLSLFNYRIQINKITVNTIDSIHYANIDSIYNSNLIFKHQLYDELKNEKCILTPQEYTNNVINYYNTAFLILTVMLGAFSFLSFVYLKSHSSDLIQEKLQSEKFKEEVSEVLVGKAEDRFTETISSLSKKVNELENLVVKISENYISFEDDKDDNKNIELE